MPNTNSFILIIAISAIFLAAMPAIGATTTVTIDGCLQMDKDSGKLILTSADEDEYHLIGHAAELGQYIRGRLKVTGSIDDTTTSSDNHLLSLKVVSWQVIVDPNKAIKPTVGKFENWNSFLNRAYGIIVRFPKELQLLTNTDQTGWNFTEPAGKKIFSAEIPKHLYDDIYGNSVFSNGYFSIYINKDIHNARKCELIPECEGKIFSRKIDGIIYSRPEECEFSLGTGNLWDSDSLHTFQNGFCYAFFFEFHSLIPQLAYTDQSCFESHFYSNDFIDFLLSGVTFIKPTLKDNESKDVLSDDQTTCANFRKKINGFKKDFSGTIGAGIKVQLQLQFEDESLSGTEQYVRIGKSLWLKGAIDPSDHFTIEECYPKDHVTGIFTGNFSQNCQKMTGYFSKPDGSQLQPFTFHEVGTPYQPKIEAFPVKPHPDAIAVNPITNKIYILSNHSNLTIINGLDNSTATVSVKGFYDSLAVNPLTNKIYLIDSYGEVGIIDGISNSISSINVDIGGQPIAVAVNSITNKIYIANKFSDNVAVIDVASNSNFMIKAGTEPCAVSVDPKANKIYVANRDSGDITIINGSDNSTKTVAVGPKPCAIDVNPTTNQIYVLNENSDDVTVINELTNSIIKTKAGKKPCALTVNPITNKVYVVNMLSDDMTVIDGATNSSITIKVGTGSCVVAINPTTKKGLCGELPRCDGDYGTIAQNNLTKGMEVVYYRDKLGDILYYVYIIK